MKFFKILITSKANKKRVFFKIQVLSIYLMDRSDTMDKPFVDMHIHSHYSDGSMTPDEIVAAANENGVGVLAVADHNII